MRFFVESVIEIIKKKYLIVSAVLIAFSAVALFFNTFGNAWTLDDFPVIVDNPDIRSLSLFWKDAYPGRPLREITFLVDYALFGLNPVGYHVQQIFWHALNAWLVFLLVCRLGGARMTAWIASVLFLVHPLHVEVVANVSHRKDSLALAFSLLALLSYSAVFGGEKRNWKWFVGAVLLFVTALYAKQTPVVLPLIFVAYEYAYVPHHERILFKYPKALSVFLLAGALFLLFWTGFSEKESYLTAMTAVMAKMNLSFSPDDPGQYFLLFFKSLAFMASKWLWPTGLSPEYVYSAPKGWGDPWVVVSVIGLALYAIALFMTRRRHPLAFLALVWMGLFWLPVSNLVPVSYFAADRYLYAPSAGFLIFFAILVDSGAGRIRMVKSGIVFALLLPLLVWLTWQQNKVWASDLTLWDQAVKVSPKSTTALNNLGSAYMKAGDLDKALVYFKRAAMNFTDPMPYYNMGWIFEQRGDIKSAKMNYSYFLSYNDPKYKRLAIELRQRFYKKYGIVLR